MPDGSRKKVRIFYNIEKPKSFQIDDGVVLTLGLIAELVNFFLGLNMVPDKEISEEGFFSPRIRTLKIRGKLKGKI